MRCHAPLYCRSCVWALLGDSLIYGGLEQACSPARIVRVRSVQQYGIQRNAIPPQDMLVAHTSSNQQYILTAAVRNDGTYVAGVVFCKVPLWP